MSNERKTQDESGEPHMEKQVMTEPMEEFIADQSVPSQSMQSGQSDAVPQVAKDVKPAGHQNKDKGQNFEPGVEG